MTLRTARVLTGLYFVCMLVFVTWPGMLPFARVRPLILGLPFSFAWVAAWIAGAVLVLWGLDRVEARYRDHDGHGPAGGQGTDGSSTHDGERSGPTGPGLEAS